SILSSYDYIIVGGGTSGLVVANRLSEDPKVTVLVIEAGRHLEPAPDSVLVPANVRLSSLVPSPDLIWDITSEPNAGLLGRTDTVVSAKVVGGGSVVNSMFFDKGAHSDYNSWETLGAKGWSWSSLLPYFKKVCKTCP